MNSISFDLLDSVANNADKYNVNKELNSDESTSEKIKKVITRISEKSPAVGFVNYQFYSAGYFDPVAIGVKDVNGEFNSLTVLTRCTFDELEIDELAWFETEDEMNEYIENNRIHVIEALKIKDAEIIR